MENKETLEEAAEKYYNKISKKRNTQLGVPSQDFEAGAKWQEKRMYNDEDIIDLIQFLSMNQDFNSYSSVSKETAKRFFEQFKNRKP